MRRTMIAGNWKMNGSRASVAALLNGLREGVPIAATTVECAVFVPFVFLEQVAATLKNSPIGWGGQTVSNYAKGAYTGEISASMLQAFHCRYVLVGHSERRHIFGESNADIRAKFAQVQSHDMIPILCVGETDEQHRHGQTQAVIAQQLAAILELPSGVDVLSKAVIAYEPVWAIGTGLTATPEQAQQVHHFIRQSVAALDPQIAAGLRLLYGGSVSSDNASALLAQPDIDGLLVGGASLRADEFIKIVVAALPTELIVNVSER